MEKNFAEGKVYSFVTNLSSVIVLCVLWAFTAIPILTIGAASSALYQTISQNIKLDKTHPIKAYFKAFKENFLPSLVPSIIFLLYTVVMIMELSNAYLGKHDYFLSPFVWFVLAFVLMGFAIVIFAIIARVRASFLAVVAAAVIVIFKNTKIAMSLIGILAISAFIVYFVPGIAVFVPGIIMYIISGMLDPAIEKCFSK